MILYDAIEKFGKDYPNIKVEIATGAPNQSIEMLHTGEIDMVLVYLPYDVEYSNLQITEIGKKEYIFAMSKKYEKENNVSIKNISDLNNYSLIVPKKNSAIREIFDNKYKDIIISHHYEVAQEQMKKEFILRNMGIGFIIKDEIKEELENGNVVEIKLPNSKVEGALGVITLNSKISNFATNKLLEYMKWTNT